MKRYRLSNMGNLVSATQGGLRQAFRCAVNVAQTVDRRRPEASALAAWLDQDRASLGLADGEDFGNGTLQKIGVSAVSWRRVRMTVARGLRTAPVSVDTPAELWLDVLADRLGFDELDRQLLALVLYYELDDRLEHLVDRISAARGGMSQLRCDVTLIALLLDDEPGAVETRLQAEGRLCASGLLRMSRDGDLDVVSQLGTLVRNAVAQSRTRSSSSLAARSHPPCHGMLSPTWGGKQRLPLPC